jgi:hypothetical protein
MGSKIHDRVDHEIHPPCKITLSRDLCQFWKLKEVQKENT